jgi:hypothetical protein
LCCVGEGQQYHGMQGRIDLKLATCKQYRFCCVECSAQLKPLQSLLS